MKKTLLTITLVILSTLVLAMPTFAATIVSFSPANISIKTGQSFNISIIINPQSTNNYVEKVELKYPPDILQVNSFTLGSTWMALTQPGYDLIDNTNGILIKSAGYPSGFSSATTFGTVSFYAKKAGSGTIKLGNGSLAFEAGSQSALSGAPVSFTITAPVIATTPKSQTTQNPVTSPSTNEPINVAPVQQSVEQPAAQTTANISLTAAIGGILTGAGSIWIGIFIGFVFAIIVYRIYNFAQKKPKKFRKM